VSESEAKKPKAPISLSSGDALDLSSASAITATARARLIVIAGAEASGKTTLITALYESFQAGAFAGFLFGGSSSLAGFEQRCYRARIASGADVADTTRTKIDQPRFLHLIVRKSETGDGRQHLLISDIAGEVFRLARDSTTECKKLGFLVRADTLVVLVDGEKLAVLKTRAEATTDAFSLIRSCLDAEMVGAATNLMIVVTKWDEVQAAGESATGYVDHMDAEAALRFRSRVKRLSFLRIAARPRSGRGLVFAYGCDQLLKEWVEHLNGATPLMPSSSTPVRQIERFTTLHKAT